MKSTSRISFDLNHKYCFPREGTLLLYKGLVKEGDRDENQKKHTNNYNRERMRILELLSLLPHSNKKEKKNESSQHLGVYARKRKKLKGYISHGNCQIKASNNSLESKMVAATRAVYSSSTKIIKNKKKTDKFRSHGQQLKTCRRDKDYIWHPVKAMRNDKEAIIIRDVMKHYQSQYHRRSCKQGK